MRCELWPDDPESHRPEIDRYFEGESTNPLAVFIVEGAEVGVGPAGFAEVSIRPYAEGCRTSRVGYLEGWYVNAKCRRTGLGRELVAAAWAREQGCAEFASDVAADNPGGLQAHVACGFTRGLEIVCFHKSLNDGAP
jgi:aminoglycoside 6'-N-acetyltransferase I